VDGDLNVPGNPGLTELDAPQLASVGGKVDVSNNPVLTTMNLGSLGSVGGSLSVNGNTAATGIDLGSVTTVGGSISVSGNTAATGIDLGSVTSVSGNLSVSGNTAATGIDLGSVTSVSGNLAVDGNTSAIGIDLGHIASVGGAISVSGNTSATGIDLGSITSVGGAIRVNGNTSAIGIDLSSIPAVSGSINVNGNTSATGIDLSSITTVGGSISVSNNASLPVANFGGLTGVSGDEVVQVQNSVTSVTANGDTQVKLFTADAQMTAALAVGTFFHPVSFTVIRLDPAALPPEPGQDSTGGAATIDPLAAYRFNFAIPTLGQNATLTFEISVAALSGPDRVAFLDALSLGNATVAVKNDTPGSVFHAFAIAAPGQRPSANAVTVVRLDANHNPLPAGSTATPAFVRFVGVTGHFSTFAVVTVSATGNPGNTAPVVTSLAEPMVGVRGQGLHFTGSFTDPDADTWTATVNFNDGSGKQPLVLNPDKSFAFDHVFTSAGSYPVVVTVADNHGGVGTRSLVVAISVVALEFDPLDLSHQMLVVGGTTGDDVISMSPGTGGGSLQVSANGVAQGSFVTAGRVVVYGQDGNDTIQVAGSVTNAAWLYGGDGNDTLNGGNGPNVLLGGAGNDKLLGGSSRDLMIGGVGADQLVGNGGDDLMIGATTAFDDNELAPKAIDTEWTSGHDFATRIANLSRDASNPGYGNRLNADYFLIPLQTAFADGAADSLTGSSGSDWYIVDGMDAVNGANSSDRITHIGP
jgi:Ca2+-binding RTX toxin-like protein